MFIGFLVSWPFALFGLIVGTRIGRMLGLALFVMILWHAATHP